MRLDLSRESQYGRLVQAGQGCEVPIVERIECKPMMVCGRSDQAIHETHTVLKWNSDTSSSKL